jgi:hypothetical protein
MSVGQADNGRTDHREFAVLIMRLLFDLDEMSAAFNALGFDGSIDEK